MTSSLKKQKNHQCNRNQGIDYRYTTQENPYHYNNHQEQAHFWSPVEAAVEITHTLVLIHLALELLVTRLCLAIQNTNLKEQALELVVLVVE